LLFFQLPDFPSQGKLTPKKLNFYDFLNRMAKRKNLSTQKFFAHYISQQDVIRYVQRPNSKYRSPAQCTKGKTLFLMQIPPF